jgi:hypothetical protein
MHIRSMISIASNNGMLLGTTLSHGTVCIWKILDGKLLQKSEWVHGGIVGSLGGGDVGECCGSAAPWNCSVSLQTHARPYAREAAAKLVRVHSEIVVEVE